MKYLSVCSGIEAATCAWHSLGWTPVAFSEIEAFPCAVLKHHYPAVPNLGDMTKFKEWPNANIDVLVGGTPCQSFSVAGLRAGLDDPRGNLMLTYLAIVERYGPKWVAWENVPGVLSDDGNAFGIFLRGLAELGYGFAYRVLDAQYVGVPQRRRRVFVVGHFGNWRRAAAVLFERHSLSGNPPPSREARQIVAALTANGVGTCGADDNQAQAEHLVAHSLRGEGFDASEDGTGRGTPLVPIVSPTLMAQGNRTGGDRPPGTTVDTAESLIPIAFAENSRGEIRLEGGDGSVVGALNQGGGKPGQGMPVIAFDCKASGQNGFGVSEDVFSTLRAMSHKNSHSNAGGQLAVAMNLRGREGGAMPELDDMASIRAASGGSSRSYVVQHAVRRLTPRECERLQGFPDDYTAITIKGKPAADGPRYKALGNSMAVPVMNWIGARINAVAHLSEIE